MSSAAIALACALLAAAVMIFIFLIDADPSDSAPHRSRLDLLVERRDTIYDNLRDLRFEHRAGKFGDDDFERMRQSLEAEAARVLGQMDELTGSVPTPATRQAMSRKPSPRSS
jgi:hypothetical protein